MHRTILAATLLALTLPTVAQAGGWAIEFPRHIYPTETKQPAPEPAPVTRN